MGYAFSKEIVPIKNLDDLKTPNRQSVCADPSAAISDLANGNDVY